jgi:hypothetical protein
MSASEASVPTSNPTLTTDRHSSFRGERESVRIHRAAHCVLVRGLHAPDEGCGAVHGGISRTVRQLVGLALRVRLAALQGWMLEALIAPAA